MSLDCELLISLLLVNEGHFLAECFSDGGKVVEAYTEPPFLYPAHMVAKQPRAVGQFLLSDSLLRSDGGNVLAYALPFLLVLNHPQ